MSCNRVSPEDNSSVSARPPRILSFKNEDDEPKPADSSQGWLSSSAQMTNTLASTGAAANVKPPSWLARWWVLDPRKNEIVAYWDLVATVALVFVALVTPVEVSFLPPTPPDERMSSGLFWCNRAVDIVFIIVSMLIN